MAQIKSIKLLEIIEKNENHENFVILPTEIKLKFHPIDLNLKMEYRLHLFLFNLSKKIESYTMYPNWDQGNMVVHPKQNESDMLGHFVFPIKATTPSFSMEEWLMIEWDNNKLFKGAKIFGSIVPAVAYASMWSNEYHLNLVLK